MKKFLSFIVCAVILSTFSISAFAQTVVQDNVKVTFETKTVVDATDTQIAAVLMIENNNLSAINNLIVDVTVPEGYALAEGLEYPVAIDAIPASSSKILSIEYILMDDFIAATTDSLAATDSPAATVSPVVSESTEEVGEDIVNAENKSFIVWYFVGALLAGGVLVVIFIKQKGKPFYRCFYVL